MWSPELLAPTAGPIVVHHSGVPWFGVVLLGVVGVGLVWLGRRSGRKQAEARAVARARAEAAGAEAGASAGIHFQQAIIGGPPGADGGAAGGVLALGASGSVGDLRDLVRSVVVELGGPDGLAQLPADGRARAGSAGVDSGGRWVPGAVLPGLPDDEPPELSVVPAELVEADAQRAVAELEARNAG